MKENLLAAAVLVAASVGATGFEGLTLQTNDWFDASFSSAGETTIGQGSTIGITKGAGSWTAVPEGAATTTTMDTKIVLSVSADMDELLTFTPAPFSVTSGYETVTAQICSAAGGDLPTFEVSEIPQAAFTVILTNDDLKAYGHTSAGWTNLVFASTDKLTNQWYTLYMDFANKGSSRYVRYSVQPEDDTLTVLADSNGQSWFPTQSAATINTISFSGVGRVQTFSGDELTVPVTFSAVDFDYLTDYTQAKTVVATIESGTYDSTTEFSLSAGGKSYKGIYNAENGKVTFSDVGSNLKFGDTLSYTITATTGVASSTTSEQTVPVGGATVGDWINENNAEAGSTGAWDPTITYENSVAAIANATFTPKTSSPANSLVTVDSTVCFGDLADTETSVADGAYAAIRIAMVGAGPTFQIWAKADKAKAAEWLSVAADDVTLSTETLGTTTYTVESVFDFLNGTCEFSVVDGNEKKPLKVESQSTFYLATDSVSMKSIAFGGEGRFTSLVGSYLQSHAITETIDESSVTIDRDWVAANLKGTSVSEARELLNPKSTETTKHGNSQYNYFQCYALGIDPKKEDEAPIITAEPTSGGKFNMSLAGLKVPAGITITATLQSSTSPTENFEGTQTATAVGNADGTAKMTNSIEFDPATDMESDTVKYFKMEISIGPTATAD